MPPASKVPDFASERITLQMMKKMPRLRPNRRPNLKVRCCVRVTFFCILISSVRIGTRESLSVKLKYGICSSLAVMSNNHNDTSPFLTFGLSSQVPGVSAQARRLLANRFGGFLIRPTQTPRKDETTTNTKPKRRHTAPSLVQAYGSEEGLVL